MKLVTHNSVRFLETLGKFKKTLNPGLHFFLPLAQHITKPVYLNEQLKKFNHQKVITNDNVEIDVTGVFFFKITNPEKAYYNVENYLTAVDDLSMSVSRSEIGKTKLDELFQKRKQLNTRIHESLNNMTNDWGIECLNYEVLEIVPPKKIREALRFVAEAERLKRRDIIISEAEKMYQVEIEIAKKIAKIIIEEGKAEGIKINAERLTEGMEKMTYSLGKKNSDFLLTYIILENYITKYKDILNKSNVAILPEGEGGSSDTSSLVFMYLMKLMKPQGGISNQNFVPQVQIEERKEEKKDESEDDEDDDIKELIDNMEKSNLK